MSFDNPNGRTGPIPPQPFQETSLKKTQVKASNHDAPVANKMDVGLSAIDPGGVNREISTADEKTR